MKTALHHVILTGLFALAAGSLHAQSMVPAAMNYQGMLTDANGDPVANAAPENRNIEFRIYSQATGGTPLWGEAQTVTVYKGQFSVVLGNGTAVGGAPSGPASFAAVFANATSADLYFGITPQGGAEFAPRQKLLSSAYALRARMAEQVNALSQPSGQQSQFNWLAANNLTMRGHTKIDSGNILEFGTNDSARARNTSAGQIGYQIYSSGLDIVGAGVEAEQRRITLWAEAGTELKGPLHFAPGFRQNITMWDGNNGFGVQSGGVLFSRSFDSFTWNKVTSGQPLNHSTHPTGPGEGGTELAKLSTSGFTLHTGVFTGNGFGLTNLNPNSLPNNYNYLGINNNNVIEFGRTLTKATSNGTIGYGTYSGGAALDIVGAGTQANFSDRRINLHSQGGLLVYGGTTINGNFRADGYTEAMGTIYAKNNIVIEGNGKLNFTSPDRTGQHINLWGTSFGIGIANSTLYQRVGGGGFFRWYIGGSHDDNNAGTGGQEIANWNIDRFDFYRRVHVAGNLASTDKISATTFGFNNSTWEIKTGSDLDIYVNGSRRAWLFGGAGGGWQIPSDRNLKKDIQTMSDALSSLMQLRPTMYHFKTQKEDEHLQPGFIAQEVEKVFPQLVSQQDGVRGMDYTGLIPVTVAAVQEQQKQVQELSTENEDLKRRLEALEKKLERLAEQLPEASVETAASVADR